MAPGYLNRLRRTPSDKVTTDSPIEILEYMPTSPSPNGLNMQERRQVVDDRGKITTTQELGSSTKATFVDEVVEEEVKEVMVGLAKKTGMPDWGVYCIVLVIGILIVGILLFCIRRYFRKRRTKDGKKGMKGAVDLESVQLLGNVQGKGTAGYGRAN